MKRSNFDVVCIGGGPGGIATALACKQKSPSLKVAIIEKSDLGGTCLNKGCIPKKIFHNAGKIFNSIEEVYLAHSNNYVKPHSIIDVRIDGVWHKETTVGRVLFNSILPKGMPYYNEMIDKRKLTAIVGKSYQDCGNYETVEFLDKLKDMGFYFAYKSGLSIAIDDIHIPEEKTNILDTADKAVKDMVAKV